MENSDDPRRALARRLRSLRNQHWPDVKITQKVLGQAIGGDEPLSAPTVSSWESDTGTAIPSVAHLDAYATLFATRRSYRAGALRRVTDLDEDERAEQAQLREELLALREAALRRGGADAPSPADDPWLFDDGKPITIVCGAVPDEDLAKMRYSSPESPDYIALYAYADLDALIELFGHLRALNPDAEVRRRTTKTLTAADNRGHLVLLGGPDWNDQTRELLRDPEFPIRQVADWDNPDEGVYFEVTGDTGKQRYRPRLTPPDGGERLLVEDVALFYRRPNPYFRDSTITTCAGMYGRGTYGIVRAFTDPLVNGGNLDYLHERFPGRTSYAILSRVAVFNNLALSPDWTLERNRLSEWSAR